MDEFVRCQYLPCRVHHAVNPGLLALQPPAPLHLHVRLDEVRRRGHQLTEPARPHPRQHLYNIQEVSINNLSIDS